MSTTPVTLDLSKSEPVTQTSTQPVKLDLSRSVAITQDDLSTHLAGALSGMMRQGGAGIPDSPYLTKAQNDEMRRAGDQGQVAGAVDAATMAVAGPVLSKATSLLTATKPIVQTVGTGILDSAGKEIMKDVVTEGPSLLSKLGPKALKLASGGGASALGLKWLTKLAGGLGLGVAANAAYDKLKTAAVGE